MDVNIVTNVFLTGVVIMTLSWLLVPIALTKDKEVVGVGEHLFLWVITLSTIATVGTGIVLIWIQ